MDVRISPVIQTAPSPEHVPHHLIITINSQRSGPIEFTFYAVNGAGNGNVTTAMYVGIQRTETGWYTCN